MALIQTPDQRAGVSRAAPGRVAKVCMVTNVYPSPFEPRIFYRQAVSLRRAGYAVTLICQHDREQTVEGVRFVPLPAPRHRAHRMTALAFRAMLLAWREQADVYHFHSPELLPWALLFRLLGKTVIYDAHEAFAEKMHSKEWIPKRVRPLVAWVCKRMERAAAARCHHTLTADRFVAGQFSHPTVTVVANFPVLAMIEAAGGMRRTVRSGQGRLRLAYVGGLTRDRGLPQMLEAVSRLSLQYDVELHLMGRFFTDWERQAALQCPWVRYQGMLPLEEMLRRLTDCDIGLVLFQPVPAYAYAGENTNKLFEYMACGLPVVASNFVGLRAFIQETGCGMVVDPTDISAICEAIRELAAEPAKRQEMGRRGRRAVVDKYNWERECEKLLRVYDGLVRGSGGAEPHVGFRSRRFLLP